MEGLGLWGTSAPTGLDLGCRGLRAQGFGFGFRVLGFRILGFLKLGVCLVKAL